MRFERRGPIAWCTIDRPERRNALLPSMYFSIKRAIDLVIESPDLQALVITGTGDVFCPGGDLGLEPDKDLPAGVGNYYQPFAALRNSAIPVVSAVNGICQGGGFLIALLSDIAVVSDRATFRAPDLLRGYAEMWFAAVLPAHVGLARARELMMTARRIDAHEAKALGLIGRLVEHDALLAEAEKTAYEILETAPQARAAWKRGANAAYGAVDEMTFYGAYQSAELPEGARAFMEKRPPSWSPRSVLTNAPGTDA
jgi:enoyl-CoA hydratase/carnithine racemase